MEQLILDIQEKLREFKIDGWLFYDFHNRDHIAHKILRLKPGFTTRRWYYFIPQEGEPIKLVHSIEQGKLDSLPGKKLVYLPWTEQQQLLREMLSGHKKVAMQYSPENAIPYVSIVDGGTIELVQKMGVEVVSSADLIQFFEAVIDQKGYENHIETGKIIHSIKDAAFRKIREKIERDETVTEYEIQQFIVKKFEENNLTCNEEYPIVAVNENAGNPHYEPTSEKSSVIKKGDFVLIDLWAKSKKPGSIYYDITWVGYVGNEIPEKYVKIFEIVRDARDKSVEFIENKFKKGEPVYGWEVDKVCRDHIESKGYGKYFIHRTGHNIGEEVHGNGVNIDNLETQDRRQLIPNICFSIEPGIYLEDFGVRSEIDVFIKNNYEVEVTGPKQMEIIKITGF